MAMEVSCGHCHERLMIDTSSAVVACPHCGVHLLAPDPDVDTRSIPELETTDIHDESSELNGQPTMIANGNYGAPLSAEITIGPMIKEDKPDFSWLSERATPQPTVPPARSVPVAFDTSANIGIQTDSEFSNSQEAASDEPQLANLHFDHGAEGETEGEDDLPDPFGIEHLNAPKPAPELVAETQVPIHNTPTSLPPAKSPVFSDVPASTRVSTFEKNETHSRLTFLTMLLIVVGSYASLLTIYAIYTILFGRAHQLESLPDLKTVQQRGGRAAVPAPENDLPPGHQLRLGQSQRYGEIQVTPIKVTRGPLVFTHYTGDATRERSPSEPVLKMWLKFENVSSGKAITPIDNTLMYFRRGLDKVVSYNVIFPESERKNKKAQFFYNFDRIAADSEWLIVGQNANRVLAPHESFETFVPSEENINGLSGNFVWRVHIRKGYGPKTGNGVTTLIDIHFNSDDIKPDPV